MTPAASVAVDSWVDSDVGPASSPTAPAASPWGDPRVLVPRYDASQQKIGTAATMTDRPVRVAVVIPSCRPAHLQTWRDQWRPHLERTQARVYVVEDTVETWAQIQGELGRDAWVIPRQSDCVRMWGYLQAIRDGADVLITMDDDVYPNLPADGIAEHLRALTTGADPEGWGRTILDLRTRGIPYGRAPVINHGLWTHVPDVDGRTQVAGYPPPAPYLREQWLTPGLHYPLSGMNLAWWAEWTPALYFGGQGLRMDTGAPWGVQRFGDIWAGLLAKRIADSMGQRIRSGTPFVHHARASDAIRNEVQERPGLLRTPDLARAIAQASLPQGVTELDWQVGRLWSALDAWAHGPEGDDYWRRYIEGWGVWIALTTRHRP